jgi:hypothetical protein
VLGGVFRLADCGPGADRKEAEAPDGLHPNPPAMNMWIRTQRPKLILDRLQYTEHLVRRPFKVLCRTDPERHSRYAELGAPVQHVVQFLRADPVNLARICKPDLNSITAIAIEDDPNMLR